MRPILSDGDQGHSHPPKPDPERSGNGGHGDGNTIGDESVAVIDEPDVIEVPTPFIMFI
jgi:hypothetical protein